MRIPTPSTLLLTLSLLFLSLHPTPTLASPKGAAAGGAAAGAAAGAGRGFGSRISSSRPSSSTPKWGSAWKLPTSSSSSSRKPAHSDYHWKTTTSRSSSSSSSAKSGAVGALAGYNLAEVIRSGQGRKKWSYRDAECETTTYPYGKCCVKKSGECSGWEYAGASRSEGASVVAHGGAAVAVAAVAGTVAAAMGMF
ncbi:hypothetical protein BDV95DRAFT_594679 [Massariosphaeria phaeospora]|uniref:Uncharacterized protein n=1 Tax=Massariosphaeria phaeospora TaxID=100035 RepID=A0A7C8IAQ4_9PLEO|nr:hypothetical protein BDV95DRAFT_594679 [Massariosphaeria phaeospora]